MANPLFFQNWGDEVDIAAVIVGIVGGYCGSLVIADGGYCWG